MFSFGQYFIKIAIYLLYYTGDRLVYVVWIVNRIMKLESVFILRNSAFWMFFLCCCYVFPADLDQRIADYISETYSETCLDGFHILKAAQEAVLEVFNDFSNLLI